MRTRWNANYLGQVGQEGGPTGPPSCPTSLGPISQSSQGGVRFGLERLTISTLAAGKSFSLNHQHRSQETTE